MQPSESICSICQRELLTKDKGFLYPCACSYHPNCISQFRDSRCPHCRGTFDAAFTAQGKIIEMKHIDLGDPVNDAANSSFVPASAVLRANVEPIGSCFLCSHVVRANDQSVPCPRCDDRAHLDCAQAEYGDDFDPNAICVCEEIEDGEESEYKMTQPDESEAVTEDEDEQTEDEEMDQVSEEIEDEDDEQEIELEYEAEIIEDEHDEDEIQDEHDEEESKDEHDEKENEDEHDEEAIEDEHDEEEIEVERDEAAIEDESDEEEFEQDEDWKEDAESKDVEQKGVDESADRMKEEVNPGEEHDEKEGEFEAEWEEEQESKRSEKEEQNEPEQKEAVDETEMETQRNKFHEDDHSKFLMIRMSTAPATFSPRKMHERSASPSMTSTYLTELEELETGKDSAKEVEKKEDKKAATA